MAMSPDCSCVGEMTDQLPRITPCFMYMYSSVSFQRPCHSSSMVASRQVHAVSSPING